MFIYMYIYICIRLHGAGQVFARHYTFLKKLVKNLYGLVIKSCLDRVEPCERKVYPHEYTYARIYVRITICLLPCKQNL